MEFDESRVLGRVNPGLRLVGMVRIRGFDGLGWCESVAGRSDSGAGWTESGGVVDSDCINRALWCGLRWGGPASLGGLGSSQPVAVGRREGVNQ